MHRFQRRQCPRPGPRTRRRMTAFASARQPARAGAGGGSAEPPARCRSDRGGRPVAPGPLLALRDDPRAQVVFVDIEVELHGVARATVVMLDVPPLVALYLTLHLWRRGER